MRLVCISSLLYVLLNEIDITGTHVPRQQIRSHNHFNGNHVFPQLDKALRHLHRTIRPGGHTYITSWSHLGHKDICTKVLQKYRPNNPVLDLPMPFWDPQLEKALPLTS